MYLALSLFIASLANSKLFAAYNVLLLVLMFMFEGHGQKAERHGFKLIASVLFALQIILAVVIALMWIYVLVAIPWG